MRTLLTSLVVAVGIACSLTTTDARAMSSNLVIAQVQTGGAGTGNASQEFIALFNNSAEDIDVSGWCVKVSDYNDVGSDVYCFSVSAGMDEVRVAGKGVVLLASAAYLVPTGVAMTSRFVTSTSLSGTRGHVTLLDATRRVVDRVAWDNKASTPPKYPEALAANAPAGGSMLTRVSSGGVYVDTDNNAADFGVTSSAPLSATALLDYQKPVVLVDVCSTIDGIQTSLPDGYGYDDAGNCELLSQDVCANVDLVQTTVPDGYMALEGNCYDAALDVCTNLNGLQLYVPDGYRHLTDATCKQQTALQHVLITEVLPNASGVDTGKEFIELYNSGDAVADLSDYILQVGKNAEKSYQLPAVLLDPGQFLTVKDDEIGFSLLNTTTRVELHWYDGSLVSDIIPYQDPHDDMSWAMIDGVWQYTDHQTPGAVNIAATQDEQTTQTTDQPIVTSTLAPCPAGKYRNPLTNRCRTIEGDAAVLAACDSDEYRNPETNRCRKISLATVTLAPCNEGYERNPETSRCRKVANDDGLVPCDEGYERNPATNRCKKALSDVASKASEAVKETTKTAEQMSPYLVASIAGLGVAGYGLYEWRSELANGLRRVRRFVIRK